MVRLSSGRWRGRHPRGDCRRGGGQDGERHRRRLGGSGRWGSDGRRDRLRRLGGVSGLSCVRAMVGVGGIGFRGGLRRGGLRRGGLRRLPRRDFSRVGRRARRRSVPRGPRGPCGCGRWLSACCSGRGFRLPHPAGPRSAEHAGACSAHSRSPGECRPAPVHRRGRRRRSRLLADRSRRIPSRRAALRRGRRDWTSSPAQSGRYDASAWTPTQGLHRAVSNVHESDASPASRDTIRRVRGEQ